MPRKPPTKPSDIRSWWFRVIPPGDGGGHLHEVFAASEAKARTLLSGRYLGRAGTRIEAIKRSKKR